MKSLNLTPAESLMIVSPESNGNEMIRLTLMDLLFKKALKMDIDERSHHKIFFIKKNKTFNLNFMPHEEIIIEIIDDHQLELNELAKMLSNCLKSSDYKIYVRNALIDKGYFKRQRKMLLALVPYNAYILTDEGLRLKLKINHLLDEAEHLSRWMKEDLGHAKAYLSVLGSHILLTKTYDIADIKKFNKILSYVKPEAKTSDYYSYYLYTIPEEYVDDQGNLQSFDFIDISFLDNFDSIEEFFYDFECFKANGGIDDLE